MRPDLANPVPMADAPRILTPPPGPRSRSLSKRLAKAECPEVTYLSEKFPIFWERGSGCLIEDVDGNTYLDLTSAFAVSCLGHAHPRVAAAIASQATRLIHGMGDVHPTEQKVLLAERLGDFVPEGLEQPLFGCSGADAVEAARKSAIMATGRQGIIAFSGAYHGLTFGALQLTARQDFRQPFDDARSPNVKHLPYPYCYRCPYRKTHPECGLACLAQVEFTLRDRASGYSDIGAILLEPVQGRGGEIVPPPGFLKGLRDLCDATGVLLIFDEILTGFGRTGAPFAAHRFGVTPDLMAIGKALGGGLPISACLGKRDVMSRWGRSIGEALHTSTFLGNPLACASALATLDVISEERLFERAAATGEHLQAGLRTLADAHEAIGDVRGVGLMMGLELVTDRDSRTPWPQLAFTVTVEALRKGLLILAGGSYGNVISLTPPLIITRDEVAWALETLDHCFRLAFASTPRPL